MRADVDVPHDARVVVSEFGHKYHFPSEFPLWQTACKSQFDTEVRLLSRAEAETDGYEPCTHVRCFGIHPERSR